MTGLIVALDTKAIGDAEEMAERLAGKASAFKVGLTLVGNHGPAAIGAVSRYGPVFADVKLHDIPYQIRGASAALASRRVWMFTVHASGGAAMLRAAVEGSVDGHGRLGGVDASRSPIVAAVTVLTSISRDDLDAIDQGRGLKDQVVRLARLGVASGAQALVCPGSLVTDVRQAVGGELLIVVPGVRPPGVSSDDQSSIVTPAAAAKAGADYIVVGRPITEAADPLRACERILAEMDVSDVHK